MAGEGEEGRKRAAEEGEEDKPSAEKAKTERAGERAEINKAAAVTNSEENNIEEERAGNVENKQQSSGTINSQEESEGEIEKTTSGTGSSEEKRAVQGESKSSASDLEGESAGEDGNTQSGTDDDQEESTVAVQGENRSLATNSEGETAIEGENMQSGLNAREERSVAVQGENRSLAANSEGERGVQCEDPPSGRNPREESVVRVADSTSSSEGQEERGEGQTQPLLPNRPSQQSIKTGTTFTASAHIITAMIGSGVLSLACSLTQLGWIGGTLFMVFVAGITYFQSTVLADCYISSDARHPINSTYMDAVREKFGVTAAWVCVCFQQAYIVGTAIAYNITSATSMRVLWKSFGWGSNGITYFLLMFGGAQIFLSQISDFYNNRFLTFLAAIMSIVYTLIGILQSSLKLIANRKTPAGRIRRLSMVSSSQEVWQIAQALGAILFAYPFTTILFEIQDTLKPPENERMKKASAISLSITTVFYILSSCLEYAAFGKDTPGSLLVEFGPDGPNWAVKVANFCIVIHLLGGYQIAGLIHDLFAKKTPHGLSDVQPDSFFMCGGITPQFFPQQRIHK
ncbi:amino acid permease 8-like isoform X2 [Asparagus officinalis]|uniref:amino acid permease 8-like isoform X2 n=1 Tax=Asparagus officinalis TaxID=4686 RepID=UPI00098E2307|nr:amino acid permease 8-like isoform X2 [Asparagus officinalis]